MKNRSWLSLCGFGALLALASCAGGDDTLTQPNGDFGGAAGGQPGGGAGATVGSTGGRGGQESAGAAGTKAPTGGAAGSAGKGFGQGGAAGSSAGSGGAFAGGAGGTAGVPPTAPSAACELCLRTSCGVCQDATALCAPCSTMSCAQDSPLEKCACDDGCAQACASWSVCGGAKGGAAGADQAGSGGMGPQGAGGSAGSLAGDGGSGGSPSPPEDCYNGAADTLDNLVDCSNPACFNACATLCGAPHDLLDGSPFQGSTAGHQNLFDPGCVSSQSTGPDVAFRYQAPMSGLLTVQLSSTTNMALSLRQTCGGGGADVQCRDEVSGGTEQASVLVQKGEMWFVIVGGVAPGLEGLFKLEAAVAGAVCGDGVVQPGEQCDDGNQDDTDICTSTCQFGGCGATALDDTSAMASYSFVSSTGTTTGASPLATLPPSCARLASDAPRQVFSVRANTTGFLEIRATPQSHQDLVLSVADSCFTEGNELSCADGLAAGGTERTTVPVTKGQTLYVTVGGYDTADAGDFTLEARSIPQLCGDGWVASSEQCDRGPGGSADPQCSPRCTRVLSPANPADGADLQPLTAAAPVTGEIFPDGDEDRFTITVGPGQPSVLVTVGEIGGHSCAEKALDSELTLLAADGTVVASNDDAGIGFCSQIEATGLPPGVYTVRLRASRAFAPHQVFAYQLTTNTP